jgi:RNA polymerase II subunit A small phosphatase-like protein
LKTLILLDLDHTLIYGSYAPRETASLLFSYSEFLKIYERPYARQFIRQLQKLGELIVFTTAKKDYALQICECLDIQALEILSRGQCKRIGDTYCKELRAHWLQKYQRLLIVDDSPQVWKVPDQKTIHWIIPTEFRGDANDEGLLRCIDQLKAFQLH